MDVAAVAEPRTSSDSQTPSLGVAATDPRSQTANGIKTIEDDDGNKFQKAVSAWRSLIPFACARHTHTNE